jgi:hypothetical protein
MTARRSVGAVLAATVLALAAGCSGGPDAPPADASPPAATAGPTPTPTIPPVTYEALVAALPTELGALEVRHCVELVPGTPEADQMVADLLAEGVPAEEAVLPDCDNGAEGVLRSASVSGSSGNGPDGWPVEGGDPVSVSVREYADEAAAVASTAGPLGGMAEQDGVFDVPAVATDDNGSQTLGRRGTGTVTTEEVHGWTVTTAVRELELTGVDGSAMSAQVSGCFVVMTRGPLVVWILAEGDVPGAAGARMTAVRDGLLERAGAA